MAFMIAKSPPLFQLPRPTSRLQVTHTVEDDANVAGENTVRTDIALLF